ncbi:NAD(P)/FAD-dependent oxidoreductase [Mesobacillus harenae]|uniref:NAD(P)/FAD-dependent oxidoreductase n=1 Tax=Mesobacillus harenae TaxID=2213203 RepID=UPI001580661D|nr:NAD(P)/FAD-dependent oxidoreductase [Mesobacillus harenae]
MKKSKIVILGGGYGGLITSRTLEKLLKQDEAEVTLINKHDYHYIATQLHKTGAGTATDERNTLNIPSLLSKGKIDFKRGTVTDLNINQQVVMLESGETVDYDYLLITLGFDVDTFGIPGIEEFAFKIRSFRSTKAIQNHIIKQFSSYQEDKDPSRLTFAVAGGGFTGVEMIGELFEAMPNLCRVYNIPVEKTRIINIEASNTLLPGFAEEAIAFASKYIKKNRVEVLTSSKILEYTGDIIKLDNGKEIEAKTLVWSGGVRGNKILETLGVPIQKGRVRVDRELKVHGFTNIFCLGDASLFLKEDNTPLPPTAQVAIQQAQLCGKNLVSVIRGEKLHAFEYHHKGTVASIGNRAAVGKVGDIKVTGSFAALLKQVIEARYLLVLGGPRLLLKQLFKSKKTQPKVSLSNLK